jgi:serine/threonine protein kinase
MADPKHSSIDAPTAAPRRVVRMIGRYQLAKMLGEGAMGRVYLASDPELGRDVAIKVLRLDQAGSAREAYIARFRNEARAAARFNHPNVVSVHDAGVDPTLGPYLIYEFIPGLTLRATLDRARLDTATLVRVAKGVAAALDALHGARIVHRDVKPDNILLAPDGRVKLTDFGIARVPDVALTRDGQFLGTPAYAAPEAIAKGEYGHRGDLFSLAAVLYEALTGTRPFPGDDAVTVSYAVVNDVPKLASSHMPGLPDGVDEVFVRGLAKQPEDRFGTARELADALAQALLPAARTVVPVVVPSVERVAAPARRTQGPRPMTLGPRSASRTSHGYAPAVMVALALAGVVAYAAKRYGTQTDAPAMAAMQAPVNTAPQLASAPAFRPLGPRARLVRRVAAPLPPTPAPVVLRAAAPAFRR